MIISVPDRVFEILLNSVAPNQKDLIFYHFTMPIRICSSSLKTENL